MTPATYRLTTTPGDPAIVAVTGELDITNVTDFAKAIGDIEGALTLDLSGLRYLDSAGFAALDKILDDQPITIVIAPHSPLRRAATLMGLPFHDTIEDSHTTGSA